MEAAKIAVDRTCCGKLTARTGALMTGDRTKNPCALVNVMCTVQLYVSSKSLWPPAGCEVVR